MAEKIVLELEIAGVKREIKNVSDLKSALKDAKSELLQYEVGTDGFKKAQKNVQELTGKLGDLGDAARIEGTKVEKLQQSFGLFSEGVTNFDGDKMKLALGGIRSAMSALPFMFLIEGLRMLMENFDEIVGVVKDFIKSFSDTEKQIRSLNKEIEHQKEVTAKLSKEIARQVELMETQGASVSAILAKKKELIAQQLKEAELSVKLNKLKLQEVETNDSFYESLLKLSSGYQKLIGNTVAAEQSEQAVAINKKERAQEAQKALDESLELIKSLNHQEVIETLKTNEKIEEDNKKARDLRIQNLWNDHERELAILKAKYADEQKEFRNNAEALKQIHIKYKEDVKSTNAKYKAEEEADKLLFQQKQSELQSSSLKVFRDSLQEKKKAQSEDDMEGLRMTTESEQGKALIKSYYTQIDNEKKREARDREIQDEIDKTYSIIDINQRLTTSLQSISDAFYAIKMSKVKKGSAEEEALARKQFELNKAFQLANTAALGVKNGIEAYGAGVKAASATGFGAVAAPIMGAAFAGLSAIQTGAAIVKLSSLKFNGGGSFNAGIPSLPSGSGTIPQINTPQNTQPSTLLDANGNPINNNQPQPVKVYLPYTDIQKVDKDVTRVEIQSTF